MGLQIHCKDAYTVAFAEKVDRDKSTCFAVARRALLHLICTLKIDIDGGGKQEFCDVSKLAERGSD